MNCLIVDDEEMSRATIEHFVKKTSELSLVGVYDNAMDASKVLSKGKVDLLFLDIEMPQMSGMELLKSLKNAPKVVFITSKPDYALEAFDFDVVDYLVKPVEYPRFLKAVHKAFDQMPVFDGGGEKSVFIKSDLKYVQINYDEVYYVEAMADYVIIHVNKLKHIVHATMKSMAVRLPNPDFVRVHRSFIVNLKQIKTVENGVIRMKNDAEVPLGASFKNEFFSRLKYL